MKKVLAVMLIILMVFLLTGNTRASNVEIIELWIGKPIAKVNGVGVPIDSNNSKVVPIIIEDRTMLPVRFVSETLGFHVDWDGVARKVTISLKDVSIELWIGKPIAKVNGVGVPIDSNNSKVVPIIIEDRTMLPVRFVSETLGFHVDWDGVARKVTISYSPIETEPTKTYNLLAFPGWDYNAGKEGIIHYDKDKNILKDGYSSNAWYFSYDNPNPIGVSDYFEIVCQARSYYATPQTEQKEPVYQIYLTSAKDRGFSNSGSISKGLLKFGVANETFSVYISLTPAGSKKSIITKLLKVPADTLLDNTVGIRLQGLGKDTQTITIFKPQTNEILVTKKIPALFKDKVYFGLDLSNFVANTKHALSYLEITKWDLKTVKKGD